jgi:chorismate dehydratase
MAATTWAPQRILDQADAAQAWRLGPVRLGYIDYLNCLPVYWGIERGTIDLPVAVKKGPPAQLNRMFVAGELDITPISSIEYARNAADCIVLPNLSISADGKVTSIFLFSKRPLHELGGRPFALTSSSATSVVLTKIVLQQRYGVRPDYRTMAPDLDAMLAAADGCLLIGDDALLAAHRFRTDPQLHARYPGLIMRDLGEEWKAHSGHVMVYALWVLRRDFAARNPEGVRLVARLLQASQSYGWEHREELLAEALRRRPQLPPAVVQEHFTCIRHQFDQRYREGLMAYLQAAHAIGELPVLPHLEVWEERP